MTVGVPGSAWLRSAPQADRLGRRALLRGLAVILTLAFSVGLQIVGWHVPDRVEQGILRSAAGPASLYTKALFEPYVQDLGSRVALCGAQARRLDLQLARQIAAGNILAVTLWVGDTIAYSDTKARIGQARPPSELRTRARLGGRAGAEAALDIGVVRQALRETLVGLRGLASGLAPRGLEAMTVAGVIRHVAWKHERRTGAPVTLQLADLPDSLPEPLRVCVYRLAQEGLSNAFRHAAGRDQQLSARCDDGRILEAIVSDGGPGIGNCFPPDGQGLVGLRSRLEAVGGRLIIESKQPRGTGLIARLTLAGTARS